LSLEGRELKAESSILHRHGRMTAEEESRETKQEEGRHGPRFLDYMVMKVKPLSADRILASHRSPNKVKASSGDDRRMFLMVSYAASKYSVQYPNAFQSFDDLAFLCRGD
jgi:hypothetical protein